MNISRVISAIKLQYGLVLIGMPFDQPVENIIQEIFKINTIPTYSQFVPHIKRETWTKKSMKIVDKEQGIYLLPAPMTTTPVISVVNVGMPTYATRGTYGDVAPAYGINRSAQGVITSQAYMMLAGQMRAEPTFDYIGNNKIKLYGYPEGLLEFVVACEHDENGETIKDSCYDSFMQLAVLDTKIFIYNNLKLYEGQTSAFGSINLRIDDYQSAEADRNELLNQWRDTFHVDMDSNFFFF